MGVLVDAQAVVKNDQLIHDEILTFSRGYVEKYEVVKRWEEDGSHHATIRAVVARDKLVAKLKGMKIAVKELGGDLAARQIDFDAKNEEQAADMFKKALAGFDMAKLATQDEGIGASGRWDARQGREERGERRGERGERIGAESPSPPAPLPERARGRGPERMGYIR